MLLSFVAEDAAIQSALGIGRWAAGWPPALSPLRSRFRSWSGPCAADAEGRAVL